MFWILRKQYVQNADIKLPENVIQVVFQTIMSSLSDYHVKMSSKSIRGHIMSPFWTCMLSLYFVDKVNFHVCPNVPCFTMKDDYFCTNFLCHVWISVAVDNFTRSFYQRRWIIDCNWNPRAGCSNWNIEQFNSSVLFQDRLK